MQQALQDKEYEVRRAKKEWEDAKNYFEYASDPDLVDYAAFALEAAKRRFMYLLKNMQ